VKLSVLFGAKPLLFASSPRWSLHGRAKELDATGLVAICFAADGKVAALTAGGLKGLKTDGLDIAMQELADITFTKEAAEKCEPCFKVMPGAWPRSRQDSPE
jgi:hypothetical protein